MEKKTPPRIQGRQSYKNKSLSDLPQSPNIPTTRDKKGKSRDDLDQSENLNTSGKLNNSQRLNHSQREQSLSKEDFDDFEEEGNEEYKGNEEYEGNEECEENEEENKGFIPESNRQIYPQQKDESNSLYTIAFFVACIIVLVIGHCINSLLPTEETNPIQLNLSVLHNNFPHLNHETWSALETGIEEVISFNKPSVLFYLYKPRSEQLTNELIKQISSYASTHLSTSLKSTPIILRPSDLNIPAAKSDYGYIINKYREALIENTVMVVKNLDEVDGFVAQAFHTFCDEISPLVGRSLFMFTMRVKDFEGSDFKQVERVLRERWALDDDVFKPLLARITSIILRVE